MVKGKTLELWEDGYLPEEIQGKPLKKLVRIGSRHSPEEAVELVFYLKCAGDVVEVASRLARDETTGGWVGRGH
ncbi:MAG TPA: hypothetical protein PK644_01820, partial [bacterium]|nr:hypothetical protein [bacterium]